MKLHPKVHADDDEAQKDQQGEQADFLFHGCVK